MIHNVQGLRVEETPNGFQYYSARHRKWYRAATLQEIAEMLSQQNFNKHQKSAWYHLNNRWYTR